MHEREVYRQWVDTFKYLNVSSLSHEELHELSVKVSNLIYEINKEYRRRAE